MAPGSVASPRRANRGQSLQREDGQGRCSFHSRQRNHSRREKQSKNIARSVIRQVKIRRSSARVRRGAIGAAIGAASGVILVVILDGALTDGNGVSQKYAAAVGAAGAGIGFLAGASWLGFTTIYKVP